MVLGLINFLLGGKKTTKVPKNAQASTPASNVGGTTVVENKQTHENTNVTVTQNNQEEQKLEFQDSNKEKEKNKDMQPQEMQRAEQNPTGKKSISEILGKLNAEIKETNENVTNILTDMKEIKEDVNSLEQRVTKLEKDTTQFEEKMVEIDENMSKFLSLYEVVNNQYSPFVDHTENKKEIVIQTDGESKENLSQTDVKEKIKELDLNSPNVKEGKEAKKQQDSLLELDTLDIEEAAGNAVPLTSLKTNTNSLVIILSWLEYMVKRVGIEETKNTLRYYTETLKWTTPEVYFELDKFLKGMGSNKNVEEGKGKTLSVKDHIVSLYFISKLNEKRLDEKLTRAVLEIIKEE